MAVSGEVAKGGHLGGRPAGRRERARKDVLEAPIWSTYGCSLEYVHYSCVSVIIQYVLWAREALVRELVLVSTFGDIRILIPEHTILIAVSGWICRLALILVFTSMVLLVQHH